MKILTVLPMATALVASSLLVGPSRAQEGVDPAKVAAFDIRVFAGPVGKKAFACFVRHYDASHLAQHPKQKVSAMKLLVTAENPPDEQTNHGFHLGIQYRNRPGNFDAGGHCGHSVAEDNGDEIRFSCSVECDGGGIEIALSKDDKSAIVRLDSIAVWNRKNPDGEAEALQGGADDKVFRVDRADNKECAELLTDREELAELRQRR